MSNSNIESGKRKLDVGSWCKTTAGEKVKFKFAWTIENFTERPEKTGESETDWQLKLYPKGKEEATSSFLSVHVSNQNRKEGEVNAKIEFSILDVTNTKQNQKVCGFYKYKSGDGDGFRQFLSLKSLHSQASQLLPDDSLTILCELTILIPGKNIQVFDEQDTKMIKPGQENLQEDLELAFSQIEFSDVQIHCGEKVFDCHQFMLSARSPVFRAMFQAEMKEKKNKEVTVEDLHPDVLTELL